MRWKSKPKKYYKEGDTKTEKKFAFLPITVCDETRWLEFVKIKYEFYNDSNFIIPNYKWVAREFVDD